MRKVTTVRGRPVFLPPTLTGESATGNDAIDALGYTMYPHMFTYLARLYGPTGQLSELSVVLFFLWDATVGSPQKEGFDRKKHNAVGRISLRQIPVRAAQRNKWLTALLAAGFFQRLEKADHNSPVGSLYAYDRESTTDDWVEFFARATEAVRRRWDLDSTPKKLRPTTDEFANFFIFRTPKTEEQREREYQRDLEAK
jgi:hypothetical protein